MRIASYLMAAFVGAWGLIFLVAAGQTNPLPRLIIGVVLLGAAGFLVYLGRLKAPQPTLIQKIDLSGDVAEEQLKCQACGGKLEPANLTVQGGAIFVKCPYCGTSYQIEEAPKW
jgi:hypothetical protein